jgi:predicted HAD superfamily phosphohydrolase YqeG
MYAEAIRAAQRAIEVAPERTEFLGDLAHVQALGGDTATHRAALIDPALDPIRSDPRFARLSDRIQREMGLREALTREAVVLDGGYN